MEEQGLVDVRSGHTGEDADALIEPVERFGLEVAAQAGQTVTQMVRQRQGLSLYDLARPRGWRGQRWRKTIGRRRHSQRALVDFGGVPDTPDPFQKRSLRQQSQEVQWLQAKGFVERLDRRIEFPQETHGERLVHEDVRGDGGRLDPPEERQRRATVTPLNRCLHSLDQLGIA
jgi:hypothetical protein